MNSKSIFKKLVLAVSIIMCFSTVAAQAPPSCEDFETSTGNWLGSNATVSLGTGTLPSNGTSFLQGNDDVAASSIYNEGTYRGNMMPCGGRICWSFKIFNDNSTGIINTVPTIKIYTGTVNNPTLFATFRATNVPINEDSPWVNVCAPIARAVNGVLPAGWTMGNGGTAAQFNQLIANFTGISFGTDIDATPGTDEIIGIDNFCFTPTLCCDVTDSPAFTIATRCDNGALVVTVTSTEPTVTNHWWGLMQTSVAGQTTDAVTLNGGNPLALATGSTTATFTITDFSKFYYIKHGIWNPDCYNWRELRIPVNVPQSDVTFHFLDSTKKIKDTFCFGEAISMYAYGLLPSTGYYIDAWRRPIGSAPTTPFNWYGGPGWTTGSPGLIDLTAAFGALNPPVYFEPGYEYEIKLAVSNPSLCIGWSEVKKRFKVICCEKGIDPAFRINPEPNPSLPSNTLWANNFNTYSTIGAVHEWYVFSSPNPSGGPYTLVTSLTSTTQNPVLLYNNALHGVQYMVIHKIKTKCGEFCFSQTTCANCRAGDATTQAIDCSKLDSLLKGCAVPMGLVASCEKQEMVWNAVPSAITYSVEVNFNDPACCRSSYSPSGFLWNHLTRPSLPFSSFGTIRYDCFRWRVKANCEKEQSAWSAWQCFSCKKDGEGQTDGTSLSTPKRMGANDSKVSDIQPQVAPNPNNGEMILTLKAPSDLILSVDVINAQGVRVTTIARNTYRGGQFNYQLSLGRTAGKGVYTIVFNTNYGIFRKKVIVQ